MPAAAAAGAAIPDPTRDEARPGLRTGAVVALKSLHRAKSRLSDLPDPVRRRLAWTMAADTLESLTAAVDEVVVISDEPALQALLAAEGIAATVVAESTRGGMNAALVHGERVLRAAGTELVLAWVADLPALRRTTVAAVVAAATPHPRSFLADATGIGTTMVAARGVDLDPRFQGRSAAAHRASGAHPLTDVELGPAADARRDVDTEVDLYAAAVLGLGQRTGRLLDAATGRLGAYQVITTATPDQVITADGVRLAFDRSAVPPWFGISRPGQRLHAVTTGDHVLAAWF